MPLTKEVSFGYAQDSSGEVVLRSHWPPPLNEITKEPPEASDERCTPSLDSTSPSPQWGLNGGSFITLMLRRELELPKPGNPRLFLANITTARKTPHILPAICYYGGERDWFEVVAEIFDPLLFQASDASARADLAYARAVDKYDVSKDSQNQSLPKYHGSYTLRVPVDQPKCKFRNVWVILRTPYDSELDAAQTVNCESAKEQTDGKATLQHNGDADSDSGASPEPLQLVYNPKTDSYYYTSESVKDIPVVDINSTDYPTEYPIGKEFTLRCHIPPNPSVVTVRMANAKPMPFRTKEEQEWPLLEMLLEWPPHPGQDGVGKVKIKLIGMANKPYERESYKFKVIVLSGIPGLDAQTPVLAEVFDPLCFSGANLSIRADVDYSRSATAYRLLEDLQGKTIPKCYGFYTMKLPVQISSQHKVREVRVILREIIQGTTLAFVDPKSLNQDQRKKLMENIVQADQEFEKRGVGMMNSIGAKSLCLVNETKMEFVYLYLSGAMFSRDFEPACNEDIWYCPGGDDDLTERWSMNSLIGRGFDEFVDWDWDSWIREKFMNGSFNGSVHSGGKDSVSGPTQSTQSGEMESKKESESGTKRKRGDGRSGKRGKKLKRVC